ncbi:hypothetical protein Fsol_00664 [Candidatus Fokinia solitaria]|uniref:Uncharacterized protein n=1 Tax=Candidatus Fokinia solitaria TaxID=1802984 RepID=A0A2U8BSX4_9RICK|nr:hypothetical protein [Candidatus Fokinia solitaria]AWD33442.1 hypothetical protein Fsol_00664 [Candidatus Fokinia solitaria]
MLNSLFWHLEVEDRAFRRVKIFDIGWGDVLIAGLWYECGVCYDLHRSAYDPKVNVDASKKADISVVNSAENKEALIVEFALLHPYIRELEQHRLRYEYALRVRPTESYKNRIMQERKVSLLQKVRQMMMVQNGPNVASAVNLILLDDNKEAVSMKEATEEQEEIVDFQESSITEEDDDDTVSFEDNVVSFENNAEKNGKNENFESDETFTRRIKNDISEGSILLFQRIKMLLLNIEHRMFLKRQEAMVASIVPIEEEKEQKDISIEEEKGTSSEVAASVALIEKKQEDAFMEEEVSEEESESVLVVKDIFEKKEENDDKGNSNVLPEEEENLSNDVPLNGESNSTEGEEPGDVPTGGEKQENVPEKENGDDNNKEHLSDILPEEEENLSNDVPSEEESESTEGEESGDVPTEEEMQENVPKEGEMQENVPDGENVEEVKYDEENVEEVSEEIEIQDNEVDTVENKKDDTLLEVVKNVVPKEGSVPKEGENDNKGNLDDTVPSEEESESTEGEESGDVPTEEEMQENVPKEGEMQENVPDGENVEEVKYDEENVEEVSEEIEIQDNEVDTVENKKDDTLLEVVKNVVPKEGSVPKEGENDNKGNLDDTVPSEEESESTEGEESGDVPTEEEMQENVPEKENGDEQIVIPDIAIEKEDDETFLSKYDTYIKFGIGAVWAIYQNRNTVIEIIKKHLPKKMKRFLGDDSSPSTEESLLEELKRFIEENSKPQSVPINVNFAGGGKTIQQKAIMYHNAGKNGQKTEAQQGNEKTLQNVERKIDNLSEKLKAAEAQLQDVLQDQQELEDTLKDYYLGLENGTPLDDINLSNIESRARMLREARDVHVRDIGEYRRSIDEMRMRLDAVDALATHYNIQSMLTPYYNDIQLLEDRVNNFGSTLQNLEEGEEQERFNFIKTKNRLLRAQTKIADLRSKMIHEKESEKKIVAKIQELGGAQAIAAEAQSNANRIMALDSEIRRLQGTLASLQEGEAHPPETIGQIARLLKEKARLQKSINTVTEREQKVRALESELQSLKQRGNSYIARMVQEANLIRQLEKELSNYKDLSSVAKLLHVPLYQREETTVEPQKQAAGAASQSNAAHQNVMSRLQLKQGPATVVSESNDSQSHILEQAPDTLQFKQKFDLKNLDSTTTPCYGEFCVLGEKPQKNRNLQKKNVTFKENGAVLGRKIKPSQKSNAMQNGAVSYKRRGELDNIKESFHLKITDLESKILRLSAEIAEENVKLSNLLVTCNSQDCAQKSSDCARDLKQKELQKKAFEREIDDIKDKLKKANNEYSAVRENTGSYSKKEIALDIKDMKDAIQKEIDLIPILIAAQNSLHIERKMNEAILMDKSNVTVAELSNYQLLLEHFLKYCASNPVLDAEHREVYDLYKKHLQLIEEIGRYDRTIHFAKERIKEITIAVSKYQFINKDYTNVPALQPLAESTSTDNSIRDATLLALEDSAAQNDLSLNVAEGNIVRLEQALVASENKIVELEGVLATKVAGDLDYARTEFEIAEEKLQKNLISSYLKQSREATINSQRQKELYNTLRVAVEGQEYYERNGQVTLLYEQKQSEGANARELFKLGAETRQRTSQWIDKFNEMSPAQRHTVQDCVVVTAELQRTATAYSNWASERVNFGKIDRELSRLQEAGQYFSQLPLTARTDQNVVVATAQSIEKEVLRSAKSLNATARDGVEHVIQSNFKESELHGMYYLWHSSDENYRRFLLEKIQSDIIQKHQLRNDSIEKLALLEKDIVLNENSANSLIPTLQGENYTLLQKLIITVEIAKLKLKDHQSYGAVLQDMIFADAKRIENMLIVRAFRIQDGVDVSGIDANISQMRARLKSTEDEMKIVKQNEIQLRKEIDAYGKAYTTMNDADLSDKIAADSVNIGGLIRSAIAPEATGEEQAIPLNPDSATTYAFRRDALQSAMQIEEVLLENLLWKKSDVLPADNVTFNRIDGSFDAWMNMHQQQLISLGLKSDVLQQFQSMDAYFANPDTKVRQLLDKKRALEQKHQTISSQEAIDVVARIHKAVHEVSIAESICQIAEDWYSESLRNYGAKQKLDFYKKKEMYLNGQPMPYFEKFRNREEIETLKANVHQELINTRAQRKTLTGSNLEQANIKISLYLDIEAALEAEMLPENDAENTRIEIQKREEALNKLQAKKTKVNEVLLSVEDGVVGMQGELQKLEMKKEEVEVLKQMIVEVKGMKDNLARASAENNSYETIYQGIIEGVIRGDVDLKALPDIALLQQIRRRQITEGDAAKKKIDTLRHLERQVAGDAALATNLQNARTTLQKHQGELKEIEQLRLQALKDKNAQVKKLQELERAVKKDQELIDAQRVFVNDSIETLHMYDAAIEKTKDAIIGVEHNIKSAQDAIKDLQAQKLAQNKLEISRCEQENSIAAKIAEIDLEIAAKRIVVEQETVVQVQDLSQAFAQGGVVQNMQQQLVPPVKLSDSPVLYVSKKLEEIEGLCDDDMIEHPLYMNEKYTLEAKKYAHRDAETQCFNLLETTPVSQNEKWLSTFEERTSRDQSISEPEQKTRLEDMISKKIEDFTVIGQSIMAHEETLLTLSKSQPVDGITKVLLQRQIDETSLALQSLKHQRFELSNTIREAYDQLHNFEVRYGLIVTGADKTIQFEIDQVRQSLYAARKGRMNCRDELNELDEAIKVANHDLALLADGAQKQEKAMLLQVMQYNREHVLQQLKEYEHNIDSLWSELVRLRNSDRGHDTIASPEKDFEIQERLREIEQWKSENVTDVMLTQEQKDSAYAKLSSALVPQGIIVLRVIPYSESYTALAILRRSTEGVCAAALPQINPSDTQRMVIGVEEHNLTIWKMLHNLSMLLTYSDKKENSLDKAAGMLEELQDIRIQHRTDFILPEYYDTYLKKIVGKHTLLKEKKLEKINEELNEVSMEIIALENDKKLQEVKLADKEYELANTYDRLKIPVLQDERNAISLAIDGIQDQIDEKKKQQSDLEKEKNYYSSLMASLERGINAHPSFMADIKAWQISEAAMKEREEMNVYFSERLKIENDPKIKALLVTIEEKKNDGVYDEKVLQDLSTLVTENPVADSKWEANVSPILEKCQKDFKNDIDAMKLYRVKNEVTYANAIALCVELKNALITKLTADNGGKNKLLLEELNAIPVPSGRNDGQEINLYLKKLDTFAERIEVRSAFSDVGKMKEKLQVLENTSPEEAAYKEAAISYKDLRNALVVTLKKEQDTNSGLSQKLNAPTNAENVESANTKAVSVHYTKVTGLLENCSMERDTMQRAKDRTLKALKDLLNPRAVSPEDQKIGEYQDMIGHLKSDIRGNIGRSLVLKQKLTELSGEFVLQKSNSAIVYKDLKDLLKLIEKSSLTAQKVQIETMLQKFQNPNEDVISDAGRQLSETEWQAACQLHDQLINDILAQIQQNAEADEKLLQALEGQKRPENQAELRTSLTTAVNAISNHNTGQVFAKYKINIEQAQHPATVGEAVALYTSTRSAFLVQVQSHIEANESFLSKLELWNAAEEDLAVRGDVDLHAQSVAHLKETIAILENKDEKAMLIKKGKDDIKKVLAKLPKKSDAERVYDNVLLSYKDAVNSIQREFDAAKAKQNHEVELLQRAGKTQYGRDILDLVLEYLRYEKSNKTEEGREWNKTTKEKITSLHETNFNKWGRFSDDEKEAFRGMVKIEQERQKLEEFLKETEFYRDSIPVSDAFKSLQYLKEKHKQEEEKEELYKKTLVEQKEYLSQFQEFLVQILDSANNLKITPGSTTQYSSYAAKMLSLLNHESAKKLVAKMPPLVAYAVDLFKAEMVKTDIAMQRQHERDSRVEARERIESEKEKILNLHHAISKIFDEENAEYHEKNENFSSEKAIREVFRHREMENAWRKLEITVSLELSPDKAIVQRDAQASEIGEFFDNADLNGVDIAGRGGMETILRMMSDLKDLKDNKANADKDLLQQKFLQKAIMKELRFVTDIQEGEEKLMQLERQRQDLWRQDNKLAKRLKRGEDFLNEQFKTDIQKLDDAYQSQRAADVAQLLQVDERQIELEKKAVGDEIAVLNADLMELVGARSDDIIPTFKDMKMDDWLSKGIVCRSSVLKKQLKAIIAFLDDNILAVKDAMKYFDFSNQYEKREKLYHAMQKLKQSAENELKTVEDAEKKEGGEVTLSNGAMLLQIKKEASSLHTQLIQMEESSLSTIKTSNLQDIAQHELTSINERFGGNELSEEIGKVRAARMFYLEEQKKIDKRIDLVSDEKGKKMDEEELLQYTLDQKKKILDAEDASDAASSGYYKKLQNLSELLVLQRKVDADEQSLKTMNVEYKELDERPFRSLEQDERWQHLKKKRSEITNEISDNTKKLEILKPVSDSNFSDIVDEIQKNNPVISDADTQKALSDLDQSRVKIRRFQSQDTIDETMEAVLMQEYDSALRAFILACQKKLGIMKITEKTVVDAAKEIHDSTLEKLKVVQDVIVVSEQKLELMYDERGAILEEERAVIGTDNINMMKHGVPDITDECVNLYTEAYKKKIISDKLQKLLPLQDAYVQRLENNKKILEGSIQPAATSPEIRQFAVMKVLDKSLIKKREVSERYQSETQTYTVMKKTQKEYKRMHETDQEILKEYQEKINLMNKDVIELDKNQIALTQKISELNSLMIENDNAFSAEQKQLYDAFKKAKNISELAEERNARKDFHDRMQRKIVQTSQSSARKGGSQLKIPNSETGTEPEVSSLSQQSRVLAKKFQSTSKEYEQKVNKVMVDVDDMIRVMEAGYSVEGSIFFQDPKLQVLIGLKQSMITAQSIQKDQTKSSLEKAASEQGIKLMQRDVILQLNNRQYDNALKGKFTLQYPELPQMQQEKRRLLDNGASDAEILAVQEKIIALELRAIKVEFNISSDIPIISSLYLNLLEEKLRDIGMPIDDEVSRKEEHARYSKELLNLQKEHAALQEGIRVLNEKAAVRQQSVIDRTTVMIELSEQVRAQEVLRLASYREENEINDFIVKCKLEIANNAKLKIQANEPGFYDEIDNQMWRIENEFKADVHAENSMLLEKEGDAILRKETESFERQNILSAQVELSKIEQQRLKQELLEITDKISMYKSTTCLPLRRDHLGPDDKEYFLAAVNSDYLNKNSILYGNSEARKILENVISLKGFTRTAKIYEKVIIRKDTSLPEVREKFKQITTLAQHAKQFGVLYDENALLTCDGAIRTLERKEYVLESEIKNVVKEMRKLLHYLTKAFDAREYILAAQLNDVIHVALNKHGMPKNDKEYQLLIQDGVVHDDEIKVVADRMNKLHDEINEIREEEKKLSEKSEENVRKREDLNCQSNAIQLTLDQNAQDAASFIKDERDALSSKYENVLNAAEEYIKSLRPVKDGAGKIVDGKYSGDQIALRNQKSADFDAATISFVNGVTYAEEVRDAGMQKMKFDKGIIEVEGLKQKLQEIQRGGDARKKDLIALGLQYEEEESAYADESDRTTEFLLQVKPHKREHALFSSLQKKRIDHLHKIEDLSLEHDRKIVVLNAQMQMLKKDPNAKDIASEGVKLYNEMLQIAAYNKISLEERKYNDGTSSFDIFSTPLLQKEDDIDVSSVASGSDIGDANNIFMAEEIPNFGSSRMIPLPVSGARKVGSNRDIAVPQADGSNRDSSVQEVFHDINDNEEVNHEEVNYEEVPHDPDNLFGQEINLVVGGPHQEEGI